MKNLYNTIMESIFDVDSNMDNIESSLYKDVLENPGFVVGNDGGFYDRCLAFIKNAKYADKMLALLPTFKKSGMMFQPLASIHVDSGCLDGVIKNLPCKGVVSFFALVEKNITNIDFSKLNFPIHYKLELSTGYGSSPSSVKITPATDKIKIVSFEGSDYENNWKPDSIKGWNCEYLIVEDSHLKYNDEMIQELIDNNPKAETILIERKNNHSGDFYFKVNTRTSKRIFDKLVKKKYKFDSYYDVQEYVWGWEARNLELKPRNKQK